jgi:hypothetical protein
MPELLVVRRYINTYRYSVSGLSFRPECRRNGDCSLAFELELHDNMAFKTARPALWADFLNVAVNFKFPKIHSGAHWCDVLSAAGHRFINRRHHFGKIDKRRIGFSQNPELSRAPDVTARRLVMGGKQLGRARIQYIRRTWRPIPESPFVPEQQQLPVNSRTGLDHNGFPVRLRDLIRPRLARERIDNLENAFVEWRTDLLSRDLHLQFLACGCIGAIVGFGSQELLLGCNPRYAEKSVIDVDLNSFSSIRINGVSAARANGPNQQSEPRSAGLLHQHLVDTPAVGLNRQTDRRSSGQSTFRNFESNARTILASHFGVPLEARQLANVPKKFDLVSADGTIVGDAKYFDMVRGESTPPAKFSIIAEHVWLLENTSALVRFLVFGKNRRVPVAWLKKYGRLVQSVTFLFLNETGDLEVLSDSSGAFST